MGAGRPAAPPHPFQTALTPPGLETLVRNHVLFGTLGPVNLISDTLEACEEIMLRGEADVLLCHYHRGAGTRLGPSHFTSVVVGRDVLLPLSAPGSKGAPQWTLPGHSGHRCRSCRMAQSQALAGSSTRSGQGRGQRFRCRNASQPS